MSVLIAWVLGTACLVPRIGLWGKLFPLFPELMEMIVHLVVFGDWGCPSVCPVVEDISVS